MTSFVAYTAFLATLLSVTCLGYLAWRQHRPGVSLTLSELATTNARSLQFFRIVLVICGTLFAISMYGYVIPRVPSGGWQAAAWTLTYISELLLALLPAKAKTLQWHNLFAVLMCVGMFGSVALFSRSTDLSAVYEAGSFLIAIPMVYCALLMIADSKRFIFYELGFIFLAHSSIVLVTIALLTR